MRSMGGFVVSLVIAGLLHFGLGAAGLGGPAAVQVVVDHQRDIKCFGDAEALPPSTARSDKLDACIAQANTSNDKATALAPR